MEKKHRDSSQLRRGLGGGFAAALGAVLLVGIATAAPAHAGDEFERGYRDQMGRILAYETVNLGKHVIFQGVARPYAGHVRYRSDGYRYAYASERRHRRHARRQHRHHGHHEHGKRHRGHDRGCAGHY